VSTRLDFTHSLKQLQDELLGLGSLVEQAITKAVEALKTRDLNTSRQVVEDDDIIDRTRFHLEEQCIYLIATQQPLATDLRTLITVTHVAVELERMGDYAEGIAKISLAMGDEPPLKPLIDIPRMADRSTDMLRRSLDALTHAVHGDQDEETTNRDMLTA